MTTVVRVEIATAINKIRIIIFFIYLLHLLSGTFFRLRKVFTFFSEVSEVLYASLKMRTLNMANIRPTDNIKVIICFMPYLPYFIYFNYLELLYSLPLHPFYYPSFLHRPKFHLHRKRQTQK